MKRIRDLVLVGGGHTHVQVLRHFRMKPPPRTRVTVVLDRPVAIYSGMVPGLVAGQYQKHELEIDVVPLARRAGARVVLSAATGIEPEHKRLLLDGRPALPYDLLSLDVGSTVAGLDVPGVLEHALPTRPIAMLVRRLDETIERLRQRTEGASQSPRVVVVGAGAGGVELAFTLEHRLTRELGQGVGVTLLDSGPRLLGGFSPRLGKRIASAARQRGIKILLERQVASVTADAVTLTSGDRIPADLVVWVTGAAPLPFLRDSPLAKAERGFVATRPTLQTKEHDDIFAVGDCATIEATPTPKAGVYAVRQGPQLIANLEAALGANRSPALGEYRPQTSFLTLLNLGDGSAVGAKGGLVFEGRWALRLKDWIDRRFMRRFQVLGSRAEVTEEFDQIMDGAPPMVCGGCAAKLGQSALERALGRLQPAPQDPAVILGLDRPDDAAAFRTPKGDEVFTTVDAFRAFTDDPFLVGRVAALNAISDLEAKGIAPRFAMALVTLPDARLARSTASPTNEPPADQGEDDQLDEAEAEETLVQVLTGAREVFDREGVSLIGGHTTTGPELVVGFSVHGFGASTRDGSSGGDSAILFKDGARPGDRLILTQPLGTGVVLHADMQGRARGTWLESTLRAMSSGGRKAAELALEHGASSATDVTGFGLAGHLAEMARGSATTATLSLSTVPALPGAQKLLALGLRSTSHAQNAEGRRGLAIAPVALRHPSLELLFDPQTAGGLLIAIREQQASALCSALRANGYPSAAIIGSLSAGQEPADGELQVPIRIEVCSQAADSRSAISALKAEVLDAYGLDPRHCEIEELHAGHINDSFRVRSRSQRAHSEGLATEEDLIAQRINSHVFRDPQGLMGNFVLVTEHLRQRLSSEGDPEVDRHCLQLRATRTGEPFLIDDQGELWRATRFLDRTITHAVAREPALTLQAGRAYGRFQSLLSELDPRGLSETIPRFHDTPDRYRTLDQAIDQDRAGRKQEVGRVIDQALSHRQLASRLFDLCRENAIPTRIAHNDAKLTNVLFDQDTGEPMAVVDLDTVMPGLSLYDFGDMARSMSHRTAEDEKDPTRIEVDHELFVALAAGYLETAEHLTDCERESLVDAAQVLVLEQAIRYLTDHLDGDRYFRVVRENQNLDRATAHLALLASLQTHEGTLRQSIRRLAS